MNEKQLIEQEVAEYLKRRAERLKQANPNYKADKPMVLFIDTTETLSMFPQTPIEKG